VIKQIGSRQENRIDLEPKHPTLERLEDQIHWYDRRSQSALRRYKALKLAQVIIAGLIPLCSALPRPELQFRWLAALLGLLVLIIEALQQLNEYQQNWIAYRSTCEALKHEKYLDLAGARPYMNAESPEKRLALLADRTEQFVSQEHAKWVSTQEQAPENIEPVDPWPRRQFQIRIGKYLAMFDAVAQVHTIYDEYKTMVINKAYYGTRLQTF
jgi:hypothetical protein